MISRVQSLLESSSSKETKTKLATSPPFPEKSIKPVSLSGKPVNEKKLTLNEEFAHEIKKHLQNSAQHDELLERIEEILNEAERELKQKYWVHSQKDLSLIRRSLNMSVTAHSQKGGTCYANATATIVRAALNRLAGYQTPLHEELCGEIINEFGENGGDTEKVLKFLQEVKGCPIQWKAEKSPEIIQDIMKNQINRRPYLGSFYFCQENWDVFVKIVKKKPSKVMEKSDFKCKSSNCTNPDHYKKDQKCKPIGHAVVIERCKYQNSKKCWRIKNSWGTQTGDKGYFLIEPDALEFKRLIDVFYTTEHLKKPEYSQYYKNPETIQISGETYEFYQTNRLGSASGNLYEAQRSGKKYAIKIIENERTPAWESAKKEIKAHKKFEQDDHNNIVKFIASEETNNKLLIALKYYQFGSLDLEIEDGQVFPIHTALLYIQGVAQGLAKIHSKSGIHGNVCAGNILIDDNKVCCLTGFGKMTFSDDRKQEKVNVSVALPPKLSNRKKLLSLLSFSFCFLATFSYPRLKGWKGSKAYFLYLLASFGYMTLLKRFRKKLVQDQNCINEINEMKKKSLELERKRFYADRADISSFGKVVVAMLFGEGFQRSQKNEIANRFEEDFTVAPLKDLCLSMLDDKFERRPASQEIVTQISRLIKEGNQIYRSHILLKLPKGIRPNDGDEGMKIVNIASSCLYNRIYNESSLP